jgi:hypothetical protein
VVAIPPLPPLPPVPVVLPPVPVVVVVVVVVVAVVVPVVPVEVLPLPPQAIKAEEPRMAIGGRRRREVRRAAFERMGMGEGSSFKNGFKACKKPYLATFITVSPALLVQ